MTETVSPQPTGTPIVRVRNGPALVVIGIVTVIIIGGTLLALLSNGTPSPSATNTNAPGSSSKTAGRVATVDGVSMQPAQSFLAALHGGDAIPADVASTLYVPSHSTRTGTVNRDNGNGPFDRQVNFNTMLAPSLLLNAYRASLAANGWKPVGTSSVTTSGNRRGTELLAQHPGSDGYYWEVGFTVISSSPSSSPAHILSPVSLTRLRLLQVPDGN